MKTKVVCLTMALFLGGANAELGSYFKAKALSDDDFIKSLEGRPPEEICSAGKTKKITLRSFNGQNCNNKKVCDMLQDKCLNGGKGDAEIKGSGCYKMCQQKGLLKKDAAPTTGDSLSNKEEEKGFVAPSTPVSRRDAITTKGSAGTAVTDSHIDTGEEVKQQQHVTNIAPASPEGLKDLEKIKTMPTATLPELESKLAAIKETITKLGKPIIPPTSDPNNALRQELADQKRVVQSQINTLKNQEKSKAPVAKTAAVKNDPKAPAATDAHIATAPTIKAPSLQEQLQAQSQNLKKVDPEKIKEENAKKDAERKAQQEAQQEAAAKLLTPEEQAEQLKKQQLQKQQEQLQQKINARRIALHGNKKQAIKDDDSDEEVSESEDEEVYD